MDESKESKADIKLIDFALKAVESQTVSDENHAKNCMNKYSLMLLDKRFSDVQLKVSNSSEM